MASSPAVLDVAVADTPAALPDDLPRPALVDFLHTHLGRFGDAPAAIRRALDYAFSTSDGRGGRVFIARHDDAVVGAAVVLDTGMADFVPPHLLVYIAVDADYRGRGFGSALVERLRAHCDGAIALHVEPDNPARRLYKRQGFAAPYVEMRAPALS
ncbi:GNAT family N-acetyltransferase [Salisaeta longa]|uniref:GNAT family N-acetyltransferase n=1 Tax=Salisaeta longa TaxID=503170 RepID=UPI0003B7A821|nr:GNAT family N-acetyltransferase [Salisaeta longa]